MARTVGNINVSTSVSVTIDNGSNTSAIVDPRLNKIGTETETYIGTVRTTQDGNFTFGNSFLRAGTNVMDHIVVRVSVPIGWDASYSAQVTFDPQAVNRLLKGAADGFSNSVWFIPPTIFPVFVF